MSRTFRWIPPSDRKALSDFDRTQLGINPNWVIAQLATDRWHRGFDKHKATSAVNPKFVKARGWTEEYSGSSRKLAKRRNSKHNRNIGKKILRDSFKE